jgi:hypothetical protein
MKILPFELQYLSEMTQVMLDDIYTDTKELWSQDIAEKHLQVAVEGFPELSLMAIDENGVVAGAIFGETFPYYSGDALFINTLVVKSEFRSWSRCR